MYQQSRDLARQIIMWKLSRQTIYPDDILNMMIDCDLIQINDVLTLIEECKEKVTQAQLPNNHISV